MARPYHKTKNSARRSGQRGGTLVSYPITQPLRVNQQLLDYVRQQLAAGVPREEIYKALLLLKWPSADIDEAFASAIIPSPPVPSAAQPVQQVAATVQDGLISVGRLFSDSWSLYKQRFGVLVALIAIPYIPLLAIQLWPAGSLVKSVLALVFGLVSVLILIPTIVAAISAVAKNTGFSDSFKRGLQLFFPLLWIGILSELAIMGGFILLVIPGIILAIGLSLSIFTLVIEDKRGTRALLQSRSYVRGHWWAVFGRLLLLYVVIGIPLLVLQVLVSLAFGGTTGIIAYYLVSIFAAPFALVYTYTIYRSLAALRPELATTTSTSGRGFLITSIIIGLIVLIVLPISIFIWLKSLVPQGYTNLTMEVSVPATYAPATSTESSTASALALASAPYTNVADGYRITPPAGWSTDSQAISKEHYTMFTPYPNPSQASITVVTYAAAVTSSETSAVLQKVLDGYQQHTGFTILNKTNTTVGSYSALLILYTASGLRGKNEGYLFLVSKDGNIYEILAQTAAGGWSSYEDFFRNVIASFSFTS